MARGTENTEFIENELRLIVIRSCTIKFKKERNKRINN